MPRSRFNPQFNRDTLPKALSKAGISYVHMPELGGLRHPRADSPNAGWRNASFRGFADYMQTPDFTTGLKALMELAREEQIALMCAEALPWRCHRPFLLGGGGFQNAEGEAVGKRRGEAGVLRNVAAATGGVSAGGPGERGEECHRVGVGGD